MDSKHHSEVVWHKLKHACNLNIANCIFFLNWCF